MLIQINISIPNITMMVKTATTSLCQMMTSNFQNKTVNFTALKNKIKQKAEKKMNKKIMRNCFF